MLYLFDKYVIFILYIVIFVLDKTVVKEMCMTKVFIQMIMQVELQFSKKWMTKGNALYVV